MITEHLLAITIAYILDRFIGDPPSWPHPVKWFGKLISKLEKKLNKGDKRRWKGVLMLLTVLVVVLFLSLTITWIAYTVHPFIGIIVEGILIFTTVAQKSLKDASLEVYTPLMKENLKEARLKLSYIVGRDTEQMEAGEIVRGTVETVAENTSDGVTAPMFWALIGGAPLALLYRAINTCDSMVGYKDERYAQFGWASARIDDIANWIPSRLTGFVMLLMNSPVTNRKEAWKILFRDAKKHQSPNSGWCEAAAAALLGVRLGGTNTYKGAVSNRAYMGDSIYSLQGAHIRKMNRILSQTVLGYLLLLWFGGVLIEMAFTWI